MVYAEMKYTTPNVPNKHYEKYVDQMPSCEAKTYAITGTTTGTYTASICLDPCWESGCATVAIKALMLAGMGFHAMKTLALKGAHVLALNRTSERATTACKQVEQECEEKGGTGKVTQVTCDLQSFESVRAAGAEVLSVLDGAGLDALICNAGMWFCVRDKQPTQTCMHQSAMGKTRAALCHEQSSTAIPSPPGVNFRELHAWVALTSTTVRKVSN